MKRGALGMLLLGGCLMLNACDRGSPNACPPGAFMADRPIGTSIDDFEKDHGKKPFWVLTFLDWGSYPDADVVRDVCGRDRALMITWEPWTAGTKAAIDYDAMLRGKDDEYIRRFAEQLKAIGKPVFLRFAHEMNGNWYPWSGQKIGGEKYQELFRYTRKIFEEARAGNVRWVFSINAENVPEENDYLACYPGDRFVDYIGLDGYNWGTTQPWSRWRSFGEIFSGIYAEVTREFGKPVIITEFSSTSSGGDKADWITGAFREMKEMSGLRGFILFNVNKETDWRFVPGTPAGEAFKTGLSDPYFRESSLGDME